MQAPLTFANHCTLLQNNKNEGLNAAFFWSWHMRPHKAMRC